MLVLFRRLERWPRAVVAFAVASAALLAALNYRVGWEVSFSVLYFLPIAPLAWVRGRLPAVLLSTVCAAFWGYASFATGFPASHPLIFVWNGFARLLFFVTVSVLLVSLREALHREALLARTDPLTGLGNRRVFVEATAREVARARRTGRALTLAYLDLDGFKQINDTRGHDAGDHLLQMVAGSLRAVVRGTDIVARLGGDEFALLLPDTAADGAREVLRKIEEALRHEVVDAGWPVGFSAGAVVCGDATAQAGELMRAADALMYEVKSDGKGSYRVRAFGT